eukprot:978645-Prorocentrum_minimum.AAC.1
MRSHVRVIPRASSVWYMVPGIWYMVCGKILYGIPGEPPDWSRLNIDLSGFGHDEDYGTGDVKGSTVDVKGSTVNVKGSTEDVNGSTVDVKGLRALTTLPSWPSL